jgi:hypothetical protein
MNFLQKVTAQATPSTLPALAIAALIVQLALASLTNTSTGQLFSIPFTITNTPEVAGAAITPTLLVTNTPLPTVNNATPISTPKPTTIVTKAPVATQQPVQYTCNCKKTCTQIQT